MCCRKIEIQKRKYKSKKTKRLNFEVETLKFNNDGRQQLTNWTLKTQLNPKMHFRTLFSNLNIKKRSAMAQRTLNKRGTTRNETT